MENVRYRLLAAMLWLGSLHVQGDRLASSAYFIRLLQRNSNAYSYSSVK